MSLVHLPAVIADRFSIPRSEARRRIALGRVKVNGQVTTDIDVDLNAIPPGDPVRFELESHPLADSLVQLLDGVPYCERCGLRTIRAVGDPLCWKCADEEPA